MRWLLHHKTYISFLVQLIFAKKTHPFNNCLSNKCFRIACFCCLFYFISLLHYSFHSWAIAQPMHAPLFLPTTSTLIIIIEHEFRITHFSTPAFAFASLPHFRSFHLPNLLLYLVLPKCCSSRPTFGSCFNLLIYHHHCFRYDCQLLDISCISLF